MGIGDWGLGTGDWGLGTGDWENKYMGSYPNQILILRLRSVLKPSEVVLIPYEELRESRSKLRVACSVLERGF
ncbi:MAG: hypothetical protein V7L23_19080 [Nostoc sp.]|uniref:hypothetical protein n=1 Tax=Nostoc sp. TaxID=1180 RepID=UPI002FEFE51F